ncbi:YceI family protein [Corynebacterium uterequi]|uniref:Lipid/polyisoprenoid-binding YceI-like domain-containing protein n=1 Tax=Corynebacterium uterequi TaxID=1072256 RepID=A0A0G3HIS9_9CORY|nr:YceI family protein [Corynebacterium uterequi]AKK11067.1 hypothetical protein CUTER_05350 [Corynebacterium uterequi]
MSKVNPKIVIGAVSVLIIALGLFAVVPVLWAAIASPGVQTGGLEAAKAKPATTAVDGSWVLDSGTPPNTSSVGFTFDELLPGDQRRTSGSTQDLQGHIEVAGGVVTEGEIVVDMTGIDSDREVRDVNVRRKLFETDQHPTASFTLTEPVDVSHVPEDATVAKVTLTGDLTIKGHTNEITGEFDALRDGDRIVVAGTPTINRNDFGVISPEMIAAKIADEGVLNIRLSFVKQ